MPHPRPHYFLNRSSLAASLGGGGKSPQPRPSGFPRVKRKGATGPMRHGLGASAPARCRLAAAPGGGFRPICGGSAACDARPKPQLGSDFARHPRPLRLHLSSLATPHPFQSGSLRMPTSNPPVHGTVVRWCGGEVVMGRVQTNRTVTNQTIPLREIIRWLCYHRTCAISGCKPVLHPRRIGELEGGWRFWYD